MRSDREGSGTERRLERSLSLWQVTVSGVGIVVGAGVYVLVGEAAAAAGSLVWAAFIVAAILAALTGLSYAELAGLFPSAGAEYEFARRAFNALTGFVVGWLMVVGNIVGAGAVALGFARYARHFVDVDERVIAVLLLAVLAAVVSASVRQWIWLTTVLVVLEVGGLLLVIVAGAPHLGERSLLDGTTTGVMSGAALVFFAFIGFDEVVTLSEETHDPGRVIPRALLLALGISTVLYVAVAVAAVSAVDWRDLAAAERPLALVLGADGPFVISLLVWLALASTTSTVLLLMTAASRLLYGMARGGSLPGVFATVSRGSRAPWVATWAVFAGAAAFAGSGQIGLVASITDFTVYAVFIAVNLAVLQLRRSMPDAPRSMLAGPSIAGWPVAPILGVLATFVMLAFLDPAAWLVGAGLVMTGLALWFTLPRQEVV